MMEITKNSLAINLTESLARWLSVDLSGTAFGKITAVYGQIAGNGSSVRKWLARKMAITDKMVKNGRLSVKCVLLTDKSAKNGTLSVI